MSLLLAEKEDALKESGSVTDTDDRGKTKINVGFYECSGFLKKLRIRWIKGGLNPRFWLYRLKWHWCPRLHIVPKFPLHLIIETTNACNLRCVHCSRPKDVRRTFLDFDSIKALIDEAARHRCPSLLVSYGGEIFLHKDAVKVIEYASSKKTFMELSIVTNATLMTPEVTDAILKTSLSQIIISIDALTKERYESIRVGADYDQVMKNVNYFLMRKKELGKKKPIVRMQMVGMTLNRDEIDDFVKYWKPKVDMVTVNGWLRPDGSTDDYSLDGKYSSETAKTKSDRTCSQLWQRLAITANKTLVLCNNEYDVGPMGTRSIHQFWHSDEMNRIRKIHRERNPDELEYCRDCGFRFF
jgi:molybdenum cofactor biosynthesis enzyme MoaA